MTAFENGWTAAEFGKSLDSNPYMRGTGQAIAWRNGFRCFLESIGEMS